MDLRSAAVVATGLASAALWTYVGWRMARRDATGAARTALTRFAVFWFGVAGHTTLASVLVLLVPLGVSGALAARVATALALTLIVVMFWGLVSYLAYVFTGRTATFRVVTVLYVLQFATLAAYGVVLDPVSLERSETVRIVYAHEAGAVADAYATLAFLVPALAGALLFLGLGLRAPDRTQRYRALLVGLGLLLWLGAAVVDAAGGAVDPWVTRLLGLVAALAALAAYAPPAFLHRYGVRPLGSGEPVTPRRVGPRRTVRSAAFEARLRDLI